MHQRIFKKSLKVHVMIVLQCSTSPENQGLRKQLNYSLQNKEKYSKKNIENNNNNKTLVTTA